MNLKSRLVHWQARRTLESSERERLAVLNGPVPKNPPELLAPTKCRVLKAFCAEGRRREPDEIVVLTAFDARSLAAIKKVEILL